MIRKVLIIRFSSIGDIVLTTPVIRCIHQQVTGIQVHVLTREAYAAVLQGNPYISRIYTIRKSIWEVTRELRKEKYDLVIDLHKNIRSIGVLAALRRPFSAVNKLNIRKWLLVRFKRDLLPDIHITGRYLKAASRLGVTDDGKGLDFFLKEEDTVDMGTFPAAFRGGYLAFVIGGKHATKIFPEEKIIRTCRQLNSPVILIGGPEDRERGSRIVQSSGSHVENACGNFSLGQSAWLISNARKVITNDTGMMHIAAAFARPVLSIWGNTTPRFGMYPLMPAGLEYLSEILQVDGLPCRPCSKIGYDSCPKGHFDCMAKIDEGRIIGWINRS